MTYRMTLNASSGTAHFSKSAKSTDINRALFFFELNFCKKTNHLRKTRLLGLQYKHNNRSQKWRIRTNDLAENQLFSKFSKMSDTIWALIFWNQFLKKIFIICAKLDGQGYNISITISLRNNGDAQTTWQKIGYFRPLRAP